ncbi:MAG: PfkB family carbohydrate kinase [Actinomycetota bacterium]|nr:PfkB family carbohydrate kinase [Actinomycetota bacterium]
MTSRVVVLGSVNLDVVTEVAALPRPGQTITAHRVRRNVGGKGANQAVAAHLLGANVTLVARVGDDPESARLRAGLAETGLDVTAVRSVPGRHPAPPTSRWRPVRTPSSSTRREPQLARRARPRPCRR